MQKIIKIIDEQKTMVRVTIADERWYIRPAIDTEGLPIIVYRPSSTWIASYYYTSPYLIKWIADKGLSEAERIKNEAGEKGSRVHKAIDMWLGGAEVTTNMKIKNDETGQEEELTPEDNECFKSFVNFYNETKPKIIAFDYTVWGDKYAGTIDIKCEIDGELGILDIKTGQNVYKSHELQLSSYKHADEDCDKITKLWILSVGYRRNKAGWKLTEVEDKYKLFQNAYETWAEENKDAEPKVAEYPLKYPMKKELDATQPLNLTKKETNGKIKRNT